ncbi:Predicted nucleic acid-binding protein, contains PIN domain [Actinopolyspora xinjiangensis]|uniref:Predicted nucleic acid-binding protein, contains PIN domain n=1 Tax=Actinopolyspora xinjiangensis TaxID=405564 RepID=A0A1H0U9Z9_9ACTN|nr:PIN domain-containing protein [Actinopolyspora xinjiangensis]SDP62860.1 Predicted nucleic acid-binding protein, contains PIN domain [Actinopolyspora xinjiangensis]
MSFPAFLDTCVLVPGYLNDTLLRLASAEIYRPLWSADVLEELHRNLARMTSTAQADHRLRNMRQHFTDAEVTGYESLLPSMTNDADDRHVLAAAVRGNAAVIVTANLRHFPEHALKPYEIEAVHPDEFLLDQLDLHPARVMASLNRQVSAYTREPTTIAGLMNRLERTGLPKFAAEVPRHQR